MLYWRTNASVFAGLSVLLAVLAGIFVGFWPQSVWSVSLSATLLSTSPDEPAYRSERVDQRAKSLIELQGTSIVTILALPALFALAGLLASRFTVKAGLIGLWTCAVLLGLFVFISSMSIGVFFFPSAATLALAAASALKAG